MSKSIDRSIDHKSPISTLAIMHTQRHIYMYVCVCVCVRLLSALPHLPSSDLAPVVLFCTSFLGRRSLVASINFLCYYRQILRRFFCLVFAAAMV